MPWRKGELVILNGRLWRVIESNSSGATVEIATLSVAPE